MAAAQREARKKERAEEILKWRELPEQVFKIIDVQEFKGKYGVSRILTLERQGRVKRVWECDRMNRELGTIPRSRWSRLWLENYGMKTAKKSGHDYFNFEVVV